EDVAFVQEYSLRSRDFIISWLNPTPHTQAVYASCAALPPPHATLASRRPATALPGSDLHRLIAPALPGAFIHSITSSASASSVCGTSGQSTLRLIREVPLVGLSQGQNVGLRAKRWSRRASHRRRANPTFDCDHPSLYPRLPFDPVKDFAPITQLCFTANVLVVNNDVPAKSV